MYTDLIIDAWRSAGFECYVRGKLYAFVLNPKVEIRTYAPVENVWLLQAASPAFAHHYHTMMRSLQLEQAVDGVVYALSDQIVDFERGIEVQSYRSDDGIHIYVTRISECPTQYSLNLGNCILHYTSLDELAKDIHLAKPGDNKTTLVCIFDYWSTDL